MARKLAGRHGLDPNALVIERQALEEFQSALYCLQAAIEDVNRDLAEDDSPAARSDALRWLLDNARPLAEVWIEPRSVDQP